MRTVFVAAIFFQFFLLSGKNNSAGSQQDTSVSSSGDTVFIYTGDDFTGYCNVIITDIGDKFFLKKRMHINHGYIAMNVNFLKPGVYFFELNKPVKFRKHKILKT